MALLRLNILRFVSQRGMATSTKVPDLTKVSKACLKFNCDQNKSLLLLEDRYPIKRGKFADLTDKDVAQFESILDKNRVLCGDDTQGYNVDWMRSVRGFSNVVLRPKETGEVSEIMKYCNSRKLAVCPQGGNTGLVSFQFKIHQFLKILSIRSVGRFRFSMKLSSH